MSQLPGVDAYILLEKHSQMLLETSEEQKDYSAMVICKPLLKMWVTVFQ